MVGNLMALSLLHFALPGPVAGQGAPESLVAPKTAHVTQSANLVLRYRLSAASEKFGLKITDAKGGVIRTLKGNGGAGSHEVVWDMRYADNRGPLVPPGRYTITLTVADRSISRPLTLLGVSKGKANDADLLARYNLLVQIHDQLSLIEPAIAKGTHMLKTESEPTGNSVTNWYSRMEIVLYAPNALIHDVTALNDLAKKVESEEGAPTKADMDSYSNIKDSVTMYYGLYTEIVH